MTSQPQLSASPGPGAPLAPATGAETPDTAHPATVPTAPGDPGTAGSDADARTCAPASPAVVSNGARPPGHRDTVPTPAQTPTPAPTGRPQPAGAVSRKPLLLGLLGSTLMALAGLGAGGKLVYDPVLEHTPLVAIRFGHGYDLAVLVVYLGLGLFVWSWVLLGRDILTRQLGARPVLVTALVWMLPILFSPPLFTRDPFSYLAYGTMPLHGLDPYAIGPNHLSGPIPQNVHWFWTDTPAPYGPLFILVAKAVATVTGEHMIAGVLLMRLAMLPGLVLLILALPGLTRHLGGRLSVTLWVAVANPVMVLHLIGGPHNDLLLVGLLSCGCLAALNRRHALGIVLVTLAMAVKATAGLALPFLVLVWAARLDGSQRSRILRAGGVGVAIFLAVFTAVSVAAGVGLGWLPALNAPSNIVNWLSLPTGVGQLLHSLVDNVVGGLSATPFFTGTRILGGLVFLTVAVRQWMAARDGGPDAIRRAGVVLVVLALLSPATLPWYYAWGTCLLAASRWSVPRLRTIVFVSIFLMVCAFPSGEVALYAWGYLALMLVCAAVAARSLTSPDPLRLRPGKRWAVPPTAAAGTAPAPERAPGHQTPALPGGH